MTQIECPHCGGVIDPNMFGWWGLKKKKGKQIGVHMSRLARLRNAAMRERMGDEAYRICMRDMAHKRWESADAK